MKSYQSKRCVYSVVGEELVSEDGIKYNGYGIRVEEDDREIVFISDVTDEREALEALVRRCNDGELEAIHIYEIVEDFLSE